MEPLKISDENVAQFANICACCDAAPTQVYVVYGMRTELLATLLKMHHEGSSRAFHVPLCDAHFYSQKRKRRRYLLWVYVLIFAPLLAFLAIAYFPPKGAPNWGVAWLVLSALAWITAFVLRLVRRHLLEIDAGEMIGGFKIYCRNPNFVDQTQLL